MLTAHEREVAAMVLREHADEMDRNVRQGEPANADWLPVHRVLSSCMTTEMREIAHKLEWL